ncbi:MAG: cation diffusion facilitator family transporter [Desulfosoma sp.]|uniref:cation diffusion facilitator family transporter n=1 Tax=Desulfosoma sp. TaxID=2603217 RepID=UPI00404AB926
MHDHGHDHNVKNIGWAILINIGITVAEVIGGTLSGSLALLSDAGHNLSDVISLALSFLGEKLSEKKATRRHTFGFKRTEIFTALINSLSLVGIAFFIVIEAVKRISSPPELSLWLMLGVATIGLLGNLFSMVILRKKEGNLNVKAAYLHLFYDAISSVAVIGSGLLIFLTGWVIVDLAASLLIAALVLWSGLGVIKKTIHIFMQGVPEHLEFDKILQDILHVPGVSSVHGLHIWSIDSSDVFLSCHICIEESDGKADTDRIIQNINGVLQQNHRIHHTVIQAETRNLCEMGVLCDK